MSAEARAPRSEAERFARFCLVGGIGFVTDAGLMALCIHGFGCGPFAARAVSFTVAVLVTFLLNRSLSFADLRGRPVLSALAGYLLVQAFGFACNMLVFALAILRLPEPFSAPRRAGPGLRGRPRPELCGRAPPRLLPGRLPGRLVVRPRASIAGRRGCPGQPPIRRPRRDIGTGPAVADGRVRIAPWTEPASRSGRAGPIRTVGFGCRKALEPVQLRDGPVRCPVRSSEGPGSAIRA